MENMKTVFPVEENDSPAPRRSHRKSRNGCQTCKRRHVRCDEFYPVCRNCARLGLTCLYSTAPEATCTPPGQGESSQSQTAFAPPEELVATSIQQNFPSEGLAPSDHQLVNHLINITSNIVKNGVSELCAWTAKFPLFFELSKTHECVKYSLLALSASHLGVSSKSVEFHNIALEHETTAFSALQEVISNFSQENSDAALASSMILSWQASDWRTWSSMVPGITAIIKAMRPWITTSLLFPALELSSNSETTTPRQPTEQDHNRFANLGAYLNTATSFMKKPSQLSDLHRDLLEFTQNLSNFPPEPTSIDQMRIAYYIRCWLYWMPSTFLQTDKKDIDIMVAFASFNAMAFAVRPFFPEVGEVVFRKTKPEHILRVQNELIARRDSVPEEERDKLEEAIVLVGHTLEIVADR